MSRVTIALPVHNGERYLTECIDSVLAQSHNDFKFLIGDNASTDGTAEICQEYAKKDPRITYYRHAENLGAARNYNYLFELASTEYFQWIAHDDYLHPNFVKQMTTILDADPQVSIAFSNVYYINEESEIIKPYDQLTDGKFDSLDKRILNMMTNGSCFEIFGLMRTAQLKATPLHESYIGSDRVLLGILAGIGKFVQHPEYLFFHRHHPLRSVLAYKDPKQLSLWFDTNNTTHIPLPWIRQTAKLAQCFLRHPTAIRHKLNFIKEVLKMTYNRKYLVKRDILYALQQIRHNIFTTNK